MIIEKTHTLELQVTEFKKGVESIQVTIETTEQSNPLYINSKHIDKFYVKGFTVLDKYYYNDLYLESGECIDLYDCGESELLIGLFGYNFERGIQDYIYNIIKEYLVEHKLPPSYKQELRDEQEADFLTYDIIDALEENNSHYGTHNNGVNNRVEWMLADSKLYLYNHHLNKDYKLDSYDYDNIEKAVLEFNKEWNSIIDGKYIW